MTSRVSDIQAIPLPKISRYRPEIDGLRAFAVVAVIINHFNKDLLPGGYLGVDIFFVISGYVITSSLFGRPSKDFKDFISGFYERRIKRLVPALSVFVLITSIAICLFNPSPGPNLKTGIASLFGLSNLYLLKESTDYFAHSTELNAFTHTWSLGVEEQFYILFPFLIWFSGFGRQTKNGARNLFLTVGALTFASLTGFLYFYPANQSAAYFLMPSRFWEMATGCLIFIGFQKRSSIEKFLEKVPPLLVLALIIVVMYLPLSLAATSTIAVVAFSSILIASLKKQTAAFELFTHPRVVYIGLISYSLYLWHWGVLAISRWTIGIHWWSLPFQVVLMLGLAIASYRWIETPFRKGNWFGKRWKTLVFAGGVLITLSGGLITLGTSFKGMIFLGEKNTTPVLNTSNQSTFYIMGDSHAFDVFNILNLNGSYKIKKFTTPGCRFYSDKCKENIANTASILTSAKEGDIVIFASHYLDRMLKSKEEMNDMINYFSSTLPTLLKKGVIPILKIPHPSVNSPGEGQEGELCKHEFFRPYISSSCFPDSVSINVYLSKMKQIAPMLESLNRMYPNLITWDISKITCPTKECVPVSNSMQYLRDTNHLYTTSPKLQNAITNDLNMLLKNNHFKAI